MPSLNQKICSVEGCDRVHKAKSYCIRHWQRLQKHGSVQSEKPIRTLHKLKTSPVYKSWESMKNRCNNFNNIGYPYYGGRGIKVCIEWNDFRNFYKDMGERPEGMTLDRYPNNDGDYEPNNCRWATPAEQAQNKRNTKLNPDKVLEIRKLYLMGGITQAKIATMFNIDQTHVSLIVNNKEWI